MSGFASGDSTFSISIEKSSNKLGKRVRLIFGTCLHIRDKEILLGIANYIYNSLEEWTEKQSVLKKQLSLALETVQHKYIYDTPTTSASALLQIKKLFRYKK